MAFLDFIKETTYQAIGAAEKAAAEQKANAYLAEQELEAAGRQAPAPAPFKPFVPPTPAENDYLAQAELESAGRQQTPIGIDRVAANLNLGQYPMQGTSSWISGADAAAYLQQVTGQAYDPNALYERPWAPGEPGVPLEILFNQMVRDQLTQQQTNAALASRELETAGQQPPPSPRFDPIPYSPASQSIAGNRPFDVTIPFGYNEATLRSQSPVLQEVPKFEPFPGQRVASNEDYINQFPLAARPQAAKGIGVDTGGTLSALNRVARPFDVAAETTFDIVQSGYNPVPNVGFLTNLTTTGARAGLSALQGKGVGEIGSEAFGGFQGRAAGGNLPENIREARGNPADVYRAQERDFYDRPIGEQVAIGLIYDPTNAVPLNFLGDALRGGATVAKGVGNIPLSALARGGSRIASAVDQSVPDFVRTGMRAIGSEAAGGQLDELAGAIKNYSPTPRAPITQPSVVNPELAAAMGGRYDSAIGTGLDVGGALRSIGARPDVGLRTISTGAGAAAGFMSGDDLKERIRNAAIGAGAGLLFPEVTRAAATGYGKAASLTRVGGVGRQVPDAVMRSGESTTPYLHLPEFGNLPTDLARSQRLSGSIDNLTGRLAGGPSGETISALARNDPRFTGIVDILNYNRERLNDLAKLHSNAFKSVMDDVGIHFDDAGAVLIDGNRIPIFDVSRGEWLVDDVGELALGAMGSDVAEALKLNPNLYDDILTPEQASVFRSADSIVDEIRDLLITHGESADWIDGYWPRGRMFEIDGADTISTGPLNIGMGREPGSLKPRQYRTGGAAILSGERGYPPAYEAIGGMVREALDRINSRWAANMIEQIEIDGVPIGAARNLDASRELEDLRKEVRPIAKKKKALEVRLKKNQSALNATDRALQTNSKRIDTLMERVGVPGERTTAIMESIDLVSSTLRGVRAQADEAMRIVAKSSVDKGDALARVSERYAAVRKAQAEIRKLAKEADSAADLARGLNEDAMRQVDIGIKTTISDAWENAVKLRNSILDEITTLETQISGRTAFTREAAKAQLAIGEFRDKYGRMSKMLGDGITGMRQRAVALARATRAETRLTQLGQEGTRAAGKKISLGGKVDELKKKIDAISEVLTPKQERIAELKADLATAREIADSRRKWATMDKLLPLKGVPVPEDFVNYFNARWVENLPDKVSTRKLPAIYDFFNNVWRGIGATADMATYGTVQLAAAADNPGLAWRTFRTGTKAALKDESAYWQELMKINEFARANDLPPLHVLISRGFQLAVPETMIAKTDPGVAGKLANMPIAKQANTFFDATTNLTRVIYAYDNLDALRVAGRDPWATDTIVEATTSAMINTGRAKKGIPGLSEAASGRLLFAGKFTRSQIEMGMNALLSGAMEGNEARRMFLRLAGLAATSAYVINDAVGEEWNPKQPFKARVLGYNIDLAGPWGTLLRRGIEFANAASEGDIGGAADVLSAYAQTKAAPVPNMLLRAFGKDIGSYEVPSLVEAWEEKDLPYLINFLPAPFTARDMLETGLETDWSDPNSIGALLFGAGINFLGIKNNIMSPSQKYAEEKDDAYESYEPPFYTKNPDWKAKDDPLFDYVYTKDNPGAKPEPTTALGRALAEERENWESVTSGLEERLLSRELDVDDWRAELKTQAALYRDRVARLTEGVEFDDPKEGTPAWWVKTYFDTFDASLVDGEIDPDRLAALQGAWKESMPPEAFIYVNELIKANDTPFYQAYQDAMFALSQGGYFSREQLPKYKNIDGDQDKIAGYISDIQSYATAQPGDEKYGGMPKGIKDKPFVDEAAWYMITVLKTSDPELLKAMVNAYKGNEAISALKSGKMPKKGTIAYEGLPYVNPEFVAFSIEHKDELLWFSEHKNITAVAPYLEKWLQENRGISLSEYKPAE